MKWLGMVVAGGVLMPTILLCAGVDAAERWQGIDEAVVQRIAREHGREARRPLIDTGEGDMQLFAFLVAGAVGGFVAGYCWRALMDGKKKERE
jgi:ABC-type cobalt transport system substrate-binding protein